MKPFMPPLKVIIERRTTKKLKQSFILRRSWYAKRKVSSASMPFPSQFPHILIPRTTRDRN